MSTRRRLDAELVRRGLAGSRAQAHELVAAGRVLAGGAVADKAARLVDAGEPLVVTGPAARFASRGGEKLDAALDRFAVDPAGLVALDAGASTGGFTDCLLQRGAAHVVAVDVGRGQLHARLRADPRVTSLERTNIRNAGPAGLPGAPYPLAVADLSFISLTTVASALTALLAPGASAVTLVKPQFEAGRREVSAGRGVVRDPGTWRRVLGDVTSAWASQGATMMGAMASPLRGADGNAEFLVVWRAGGGPRPAADVAADLDAAVEEAAGWR